MNGDKVVLAKITRPRAKITYLRRDLHLLLDELRATPLIVVSGPPGSGKSTLVASYVESRKIACLWYRLDRGDEDPAIFFYYLGLAALKANPLKKTALPRMPLDRGADVVARAREYFHSLYQCLATPFIIAFDDHHAVSKDSLLQEVLRLACAALPKCGRMVLIGRDEGPANPACLRTECSTAVIGREELQFSAGEIREIAASHGVALSSDEAVDQLRIRAGGSMAELIHVLQRGLFLPVGD